MFVIARLLRAVIFLLIIYIIFQVQLQAFSSPFVFKIENFKVESTSSSQKTNNFHKEESLNNTIVEQKYLNIFDLVHNEIDFVDSPLTKLKKVFDLEVANDEFMSGEPLEIFLTPYSHMDYGWLTTPEQYYLSYVKNIYNSVIDKLSQEPSFRFSFSEVAFLERWLRDASFKRKKIFINSLKSGQIEILHGGWVMPDEACTHYYNLIDQLIVGHSFLKKTFGNIELTTSWSVDSFGLSSIIPYLSQISGLKYEVATRLHYLLKNHMAKNKQFEFLWKQNWDKSKTYVTLTHVLFDHYDILHTCGPNTTICCEFDFARIIINQFTCLLSSLKEITPFNVVEKSELLINEYRKISKMYRTRKLFVPLMDDFRFTSKEEVDIQFKNYKKIMKYVNTKENMRTRIKWATPGEYMKAIDALRDEAAFPTLEGDFFTYADKLNEYWSGYYSTRPFVKRMDRIITIYRRKAESLFFFLTERQARISSSEKNTNFLQKIESDMNECRRNHASVQHHDSITGTSNKQANVFLIKTMIQTVQTLDKVITNLMSSYLSEGKQHKITVKTLHIKKKDYGDLELVTIEELPTKVMIFNDLPVDVEIPVNVLVSTQSVSIRKINSVEIVTCQISPHWDNLEINLSSSVLTFVAHVPAYSVVPFTISQSDQPNCNKSKLALMHRKDESKLKAIFSVFQLPEEKNFHIYDQKYKISFSRSTFHLESFALINNTEEQTIFPISTRLEYIKNDHLSGAYIFSSHDPKPNSMNPTNGVIIDGPLFSCITSLYSNSYRQSIKIWKYTDIGKEGIHIETIHKVDTSIGQEILFTLESGIKNSKIVFYTDLNGFQFSKRMYSNKYPLQGSVYPATSAAFIEDSYRRMTILMDHTHGVFCNKIGDLSVIIDRSSIHHDSRGVQERLSDDEISSSKFIILIEQIRNPQSSSSNKDQNQGYISMSTDRLLKKYFDSPPFAFEIAKITETTKTTNFLNPFLGVFNIDVINLRTYDICKSKKDPISLQIIIRPMNYDNRFHPAYVDIDNPHDNANISLNFSTYFPNASKIAQISLTNLREVNQNTTFNLNSGEIYSFLIEYKC